MSTQTKSAGVISPEIEACIHQALEEDIGPGDLTTNSIIPREAITRGRIIAKQQGTIAGLDVAAAVFLALDDTVDFIPLVKEGAQVESGSVVAELWGAARALLTAERTALNFLGRMSGIATLTKQFVNLVAGTKAKILDTRKTVPGLRALDKIAVLRGGGQNHRHGLYDMILIKDNHIDHAGSLMQAVERARADRSAVVIEVEARTLADVKTALELGVERILLDNMTLEMMREAVGMNSAGAKLEASGNVTLENVRQIADTGIDFISVGALTHSARVFDVSMELENAR